MFYRNYLALINKHRNRDAEEKLLRNFERKQKKVNQTIFIKDLLIYSPKHLYSFGEFHSSVEHNETKGPVLERLEAHVAMLASIANTYHQRYFCSKNKEGIYKIKPACLNQITRLSLNEFALYTKTPLTMKEYAVLFEKINKIAEGQHANVHLFLSSIAVVTEDKKILNMSLYVQCGPNFKIEAFCKSSASSSDVAYTETVNFSQRSNGDLVSPKAFICPFGTTQSLISSSTVFDVMTEGGAVYTQAIDVCLDHRFQHSKRLLIEMAMSESQDTHIIPEQVDHLVTSNAIEIHPYSLFTAEQPLHIDTKLKNKRVAMKEEKVKAKDFKCSDENRVSAYKNSFIVTNPSFGFGYEVVPLPMRQLGGFHSGLERIVLERNKFAKKALITARLNFNQVTPAIQRKNMFDQLTQLYQVLSSKCESSFFERAFKTEQFYLKAEALAIINQHYKVLMYLDEDHISAMLAELPLKLRHIGHGVECSFTQEILSQVFEAIDNRLLFKLPIPTSRGLSAGSR